jgi:hypothetical protein
MRVRKCFIVIYMKINYLKNGGVLNLLEEFFNTRP